ncbi:MAG: hypothetical protein DWP92_06965 [Armatimonadetes bacterium]|nr:MAG: hypothetical protein DWP92_06965 [Armatimonadota bacterium]
MVFNGAFLTLVPSWYTGCTYVLLPAYQPDLVLETMAAEGVTHTIMVPSQLIELMQRDDFALEHLPAVEMIGSVGAPLHLEHKIALERRFPDRIVEIYGLTEGFGTVLDAHDFHHKTESVGIPPPLFEMRIIGDDGADLGPGEVGEIVGRSPLLMPGYHNRPRQTAEVIRDGWLHSGDLGYVDDDGYLYLVDRKKDVIISGGVNVYPRDIEEIMVQHPSVKDVVVFGAPDDRWGEAPVAAVTLTAGLNAETLRDWVNDRLEARFQKLREVIIRDSFPLSTAGKIIRREVKAQYGDEGP